MTPRILFWRRPPADTGEARAHLAAARALDRRADRIIRYEREMIRANHFGPKIAAALREARR